MNPFSCSTRKSASSSQLSRYWITTWCGTYCQKGCLVCLLPCVALIAIVLLNFRSSKQPNLLWLAMEEMYRTTLGTNRLSEHVRVSRIRRRVKSNTRFVKIAWKAESEFWKRNIKPLCVHTLTTAWGVRRASTSAPAARSTAQSYGDDIVRQDGPFSRVCIIRIIFHTARVDRPRNMYFYESTFSLKIADFVLMDYYIEYRHKVPNF